MAADQVGRGEISLGGYRITPEGFRIRAPREAVAQHVTMRVSDSRVFAATAGARRVAARTFIEAGERCGLLAFRVVDTHAHAVVACSRAEAGQFARRVEIALRARLRIGCPFDPARIRPVLDQWHLEKTIQYIHDQERRHGLASDPAHDGSSLPDLCRWRVIPAGNLAQRTRELVPRLVVKPPLTREALQAAQPALELLPDAAAAALALPSLRESAAERGVARRAAVIVAELEGMRDRGVVAELLGITRRRVEQIVAAGEGGADARVVYAVRVQLRLRSALAMAR